jgi:ankyrin repeat protein
MKRKNTYHNMVCCIICAVILGAVLVSVSTAAADRRSKGLDQELLKAVRDGNLERVRSAIRRGANVNTSTEFGETPLHLVTNLKIAEALIGAGANPNARDREFAMTPLFYADAGASRLLISKGAAVNVRARKGMTPLAWAVYWDQKEKVAVLIEHGANPNATDDDGKSPLHVAANWGKMEIARLLISKGADVNVKDNACWTPLHWAALEGTPETMDMLLSAGADCNALSCPPDNAVSSAETPLDVAARWRSPDVSAYLESKGCKRKP